VKDNSQGRTVRVTADGAGIVSHAGAGLLREVATSTGLVEVWDEALAGTYKAVPVHSPGRVLTDLAVAIADGAKSISGLAGLRDRPGLFGPVASTATAWRVLDRVGPVELGWLREGRAHARAQAWAAGAAPDPALPVVLDIDATIVTAHSEKVDATPTWKKTFGFHPLLCFLDRPDISSGEALAGILRPGNAGSNTAVDHVTVLDLALANLPDQARPDSGADVLVRADSAGATKAFLAACRARRVTFSVGFHIDHAVRDAIGLLPEEAWSPAVEADGGLRDGARVAELTGLVDLDGWPEGTRLIVRAERPHPGAALSLFDTVEGLRHTAFVTDTAVGIVSGHIAGLELRHRHHARVEDRIRQAKAAGLANLPCRDSPENRVWLELVFAAADLVCWSKLLCFADTPDLARCEIDAYRYRILHAAGRLTTTARRVTLRLDRTWTWARALARAFARLHAAFA
jgi:hypothetical protein